MKLNSPKHQTTVLKIYYITSIQGIEFNKNNHSIIPYVIKIPKNMILNANFFNSIKKIHTMHILTALE